MHDHIFTALTNNPFFYFFYLSFLQERQFRGLKKLKKNNNSDISLLSDKEKRCKELIQIQPKCVYNKTSNTCFIMT